MRVKHHTPFANFISRLHEHRRNGEDEKVHKDAQG